MAEIRINATGELKLYDSDDSNYVSFKSAGTVSSNVAWVLPSADGSSGQMLSTNGSGTLSWATASSADPSSADGDSLGTASAEWSDLYLADGGIIYLGNDQDVKLTHNADKGLIIKHSATADDKPVILTLQTGETDMAANDVIGKIEFQAPDEGTGTDAVLVAAAIQAVSEGDFSSSSNATSLQFMTGASEAATEKMTLTSAGILNAGKIGVIGDHDLGTGLHVKTGDSGLSAAHTQSDDLVVESDGHTGITITSPAANQCKINFCDTDDDVGSISYNHSDNNLSFRVNDAERFRVISTGNLTFAKTSDAFGTAGHILYGESGSVGGTQFTSETGITPLSLNRLGDDGNLMGLFQAGSVEGTITVSGTTVAYNTFCGAHWSRLADNSKPTILRGTVIESIATMIDWYQAVADVAESIDSDGNVTPAHQVKESINLPNGKSVGDAVTFKSRGKDYTGKYVKEDNEQLPMCKISNTADSKSVYGVFMAWDDADDGLDGDVNDMHVASLGAFVVRVHKDQTVAIGDYLVSNGDGTAKKQADDILRSSTIAKVTSTTKTITHADDSYCVPCTLHCG